MQAIILAAGMGKRLKEYTKNKTKCMVEVNGVTLIERMLTQLDRKNLNRIIVVTGYEGTKLREFIGSLAIHTSIEFVDNSVYDKTNNIYSLYLASDYMKEDDTLLLESDIIFEESVLDALLLDPRKTLALVEEYKSWMDGTCLKLDDDDNIIDFISGKSFDFNHSEGCFKTVNLYKFSKEFSETHYLPFLKAYIEAIGNNEYYEQVLRVITMLDNPEIKAKRLDGQKWYEIDDEQDLDIASTIFDTDDDNSLHRMEHRYGGYWRFPKVLDFCYLVNPYFPPKKMVDEMKASFSTLLTNYPSGMDINSMLVAKNFGVCKDNIIVGNGAAELIKELMLFQDGKIGMIRPTFEEYGNRYDKSNILYYEPTDDFRYGADDLIDYYGDKGISAIVIINPDNPSGNYLFHKDIIKLIEWTKEKGIKIIIDESFVDFSEEENSSLITQEIIDSYSNLYVIKSISKSFGVPGIRLGILVSGDIQTIDQIKKNISIWNINSLAEFYLQIYEKYRKDYSRAIELLKTERKRFLQGLRKIEGIRVLDSQSNYFMIEILNGVNSTELAKRLLREYNILIKDLSKKISTGQYIRISIRNESDNNRLLHAIGEIMKGSN